MKYLIYSLFFVFLMSACDSGQETNYTQIEPGIIPSGGDQYKIDVKQSVCTWIISSNRGKLDGYVEVDDSKLTFDTAQSNLSGTFSLLMPSLWFSENEVFQGKQGARITLDETPDVTELLQVDSFPTLDIELMNSTATTDWKPVEATATGTAHSPEPYKSFMLPDYTHTLKMAFTVGGISKMLIVPAKISLQENAFRLEARFNIESSNWPLFESAMQQIEFANADDFLYETLNVGIVLLANRVSD